MRKVYRIHVNIIEDGDVKTYGVQGDDLLKVTRKARKLADTVQFGDPSLQVNFFLFEAEFKDVIFPEDMQKELMK